MSVKALSDIADIRHSVTVRVDAKQAYHFFLERFPSWWPHQLPDHETGVPARS